jgi:hypothetical protein
MTDRREMSVQRWTSTSVEPSENGGFVAYGDYLALLRQITHIEQCAKVIEPKTPRPCDCDVCDCGNSGDMRAVAWWDEAMANAAAIRALAQK